MTYHHLVKFGGHTYPAVKGSGEYNDRNPSSQVIGGHRHCSITDIILLVCHVVSQDLVIKESSDFVGRSISRLSYHPGRFGGQRHSGRVNIMLFVCHVTTWPKC